MNPGQTTTVSPEQRFTKGRPCPICGGYDTAPRGQSVRCHGFMSSDGEWAHCSREEFAGAAPYNDKTKSYVHKLEGDCRCGARHGFSPAGSPPDSRRSDRPRKEKGQKRRIVKTYDYLDENGNLVSQTVRYDPKGFSQRRPKPGGGWIWNLQDVQLILYRLQEILVADKGTRTLVCAGEKDADTAAELGFLATTNPLGEGKWRHEYSEALRGRPVVIIAHNDEAGRKHAEDVAHSLYGKAASIKVINLPGVPEGGGDLTDWTDAGRTREELEHLIDETPEWTPPELGLTLRTIRVNNRHLRDVTSDALAALVECNEPPEVFVRSGALVRVREDENGVPQIQVMEDSHVRGRLARVSNFVRITDNGETRVNPPEVVVKDLQALEGWGLPALEAVVESPILRPDGTIFDTPGYDPRTRLFYNPVKGFELPKIPERPSRTDIEDAIRLVDEAIGEFPYEDASSAANTLGLILTPLVRQAVDGPVPMALIDKPQAGTGGSLLAETVALIASGRGAEMLGAPRDDEEWRKQITAKLSSGATMITVDNVEGPLFAPSLARALTARTWTDRVLGRSESITLSQRATWLATGNNIILRGDLPRRCFWIRLDAKKTRPWQRGGFKHPDLLSWVSKNRGSLVHALLTIARAWFVAGKPKTDGVLRLGSFESWAETVGGIVAYAGIPGFLGNLEALYEKADEGNREWEGFLAGWSDSCGADPITVAALTQKIKDSDKLRNALPPDLAEAFDKSQGTFSRKLGNALSKRAGTHYGEDGLRVVKAGEFRRAVQWKLETGSAQCEFVSLVSLYNSSAGKKEAYNTDETGNNRVEGPETNSNNSQTHTKEKVPVSFDLQAGESATIEELRERRSQQGTADDGLEEDLAAVRELFEDDEGGSE